MSSKKKILLEIAEEKEYYAFIEKYRAKRELSFTAAVKQLVFDRIDELKKQDELQTINILLSKLQEKEKTV